jgi:hypothetical protein
MNALSSASSQAQSTPAAIVSATLRVVQPGCGLAYTEIQRHGLIKHPRYGINSSYSIHVFQLDESIPSALGFNALVERVVDGQYHRFAGNAIQDPPAGDTQFLGASLTLDFQLQLCSDDLLSVQLYGRLYLDGTVRPGGYSYGINYSLKTGKELLLADLFDPATDWLRFVEDYTLAELNKQKLALSQYTRLADIWQWNLTEQGLLITFDELQFDRGTGQMFAEVTIPYSALRRFFKTNSPLPVII